VSFSLFSGSAFGVERCSLIERMTPGPQQTASSVPGYTYRAEACSVMVLFARFGLSAFRHLSMFTLPVFDTDALPYSLRP
jgi:hypothetical protein